MDTLGLDYFHMNLQCNYCGTDLREEPHPQIRVTTVDAEGPLVATMCLHCAIKEAESVGDVELVEQMRNWSASRAN